MLVDVQNACNNGLGHKQAQCNFDRIWGKGAYPFLLCHQLYSFLKDVHVDSRHKSMRIIQGVSHEFSRSNHNKEYKYFHYCGKMSHIIQIS